MTFVQRSRDVERCDLRTACPLAEVRDIVKVFEAILVLAGESARFPGRRERRGFGGELFIEVADILLAADGGDEGRGEFPLQQCLPVQTLTEREERERKVAVTITDLS